MNAGAGQKSKILYLMKIFLEHTDEEHSVTMSDIIEIMREYGIDAERKSVYSDIEKLRVFGMDIIGEKCGRNYCYRLVSRQFELAELKLLVDSVQAAKFISEKKSNALIAKIEKTASRYEAGRLQRQVYVSDRTKSDNEQILYNIDAIHDSISKNKKITFRYFSWNEKKQRELKNQGLPYEVSPLALIYSEDYYYLVAVEHKKNGIRYYRVDKMLSVVQSEEKREAIPKNFDIAKYSKKRFHMFDGEETDVQILAKNSYANVIIDRFGKNVPMQKKDGAHFLTTVHVAESPQFYGWVMSMAEGMKIVGPPEVVKKVRETAAKLANQYLSEAESSDSGV